MTSNTSFPPRAVGGDRQWKSSGGRFHGSVMPAAYTNMPSKGRDNLRRAMRRGSCDTCAEWRRRGHGMPGSCGRDGMSCNASDTCARYRPRVPEARPSNAARYEVAERKAACCARALEAMAADPGDRRHGTLHGYNCGCRCDACREANSSRRRRAAEPKAAEPKSGAAS